MKKNIKFLFCSTVIITVMFFCPSLLYSQSTDTCYTVAGTHTFLLPTECSQLNGTQIGIQTQAWGAGGGGGANEVGANNNGVGGGGGGATSLGYNLLSVGTTYTIVVGAGGAGEDNTDLDGTDGGDSYLLGPGGQVVMADGGKGGKSYANGKLGGAGGSSATSIGDVSFSGGLGGFGNDGAWGQSGAGGSSAGYGANGNPGGTGDYDNCNCPAPTTPAPSGGGAGGEGGAGGGGSKRIGGVGVAFGGGGAGGTNGDNSAGQVGGDGQVCLSWASNQGFYVLSNYVNPSYVTSVVVEVWGAGAGGLDNNSGGGGSGAFSTSTITVTPNATLVVSPGSPGNANGGNGGDSWFSLTGVAPTSAAEGVFAEGGQGGNGGALTYGQSSIVGINAAGNDGGSAPDNPGDPGSGGAGGSGGVNDNVFENGQQGESPGGGGGGGLAGAIGAVGGYGRVRVTKGAPYSSIAANQVADAVNCSGDQDVPLHSLAISGGNIGPCDLDYTITDLDFTTTGDYLASDIVQFELYSTTGATFSSPTLIATNASPTTAGLQSFTGFTYTVNVNTEYLWVVADLSATASGDRTITVNNTANVIAISPPTGSSAANSTQTFADAAVLSSATTATICTGSTFNYTATSVLAGTYTWSRATQVGITEVGVSTAGNVSETLTNTTAAVIDVTYVYLTTTTGGGSCLPTSENVIVSVNPLADATITGTGKECQGAIIQPEVLFTGSLSNAPYTFIYNKGAVTTYTAQTINAATSTVTVSQATGSVATYTYNIVSVEDANGCISMVNGNVEIEILAPLTGTVSSSDYSVCQDNATIWTFTGGSGTPNYTFDYTVDSVNSGVQTTGSIGPTSGNSITWSTPNAINGDTAIVTITGISDNSGFACPTSNVSFDTLIIHPIPESTIEALSGNNVCADDSGTHPLKFQLSNAQSLPVLFTYSISVNSNPPVAQPTLTVTLSADTTIYVSTPAAGDVVEYSNGSPSSAFCPGSGSGNTSIISNPIPTATVGGSSTTCGVNTATITGTATNHTTIAWASNSSSGGIISGANTFTASYTPSSTEGTSGAVVTLTMTATNTLTNCTVASDTHTLTIVPGPTVGSGELKNVCDVSSASITSIANNYNSLSWSHDGAAAAIATNGLSVMYTPLASDAGNTILLNMTATSTVAGCVGAIVTHTVNVGAQPEATGAYSQTVCAIAAATITGTATNYTRVNWMSDGAGTLSATTTTANYIATATEALSGAVITLTMTATNTNGVCADAVESYTVTIDRLPTAISLVDTATTCEDSIATTIEGFATDGTILWEMVSGLGTISANATSAIPTFLGGGAGVNVLKMTVTSTNACAAATVTTTATVITDPLPSASTIGVIAVMCEGSAHTVAGAIANDGTIQWSHNGSGALSYSTTISPIYNAVTADAINSAAGNPVVLTKTVTSNNACGTLNTATAIYTISVDELPMASTSTLDAVCEDGTRIVSGANSANGLISWNVISGTGSITLGGNSLTPTYTAAGSGTAVLEIKVTSTNVCGPTSVATATTSIVNDNLPTALLINGNTTICENETTTDIIGFVTNATYEWTAQSPEFGSITAGSTTSSPTFEAIGPGATSLLLTARSNNACVGAIATNTATIVTDPLPTAFIVAGNTTICENANTNTGLNKIEGAATNGSINWSVISGPGFIASGNSSAVPIFTGGGASSASLSVLEMKVTSTNSCGAGETRSVIATVITDPLPEVEVLTPNQTICEIGITTVAGTGTYGTPLWVQSSGNGRFEGNGSIGVYTSDDISSATFKLVVTSVNACAGATAEGYATISKVSLPKAEVYQIKPDSICLNTNRIITNSIASANYGLIKWTSNAAGILTDETTETPSYVPAEVDEKNLITLTMLVESDNECMGNSASAEYLLYINSLPSGYIIRGNNQCEGAESPIVTLVGAKTKAPYSFAYYIGEDKFVKAIENTTDIKTGFGKSFGLPVSTQKEAVFTFSLQTVTDAHGCEAELIASNTDTIEILRKPYADFYLDKRTTTLYESKIEIEESSIDATIWEWSFGDNSVFNAQYPEEHTYSDSGTFNMTLKVSNESGCKDSTMQVITVEMPTSVYIPSSFTPNGDGVNDTFLPKGDGITEYSLTIFNRWGVVVFNTSDINEGWDGMVDGDKPDSMDAYVYLVIVKDIKQHDQIYRGSLNLIW